MINISALSYHEWVSVNEEAQEVRRKGNWGKEKHTCRIELTILCGFYVIRGEIGPVISTGSDELIVLHFLSLAIREKRGAVAHVPERKQKSATFPRHCEGVWNQSTAAADGKFFMLIDEKISKVYCQKRTHEPENSEQDLKRTEEEEEKQVQHVGEEEEEEEPELEWTGGV